MDGESRALLSDCFLRPLADARSTNERKEPEAVSIKSIHKTEMQLLTLKDETVDLITSTLKYLYGDDFEFSKAESYKNQQKSKIKKSYWIERGELVVVKGGSDYSYLAESGEEGKRKVYAILKLETYGFHSRHCSEVLDAFDDNLDDSLNFLYDKYFPTRKKSDNQNESDDAETRALVMEDEKESLKSIFLDEFEEIERNSVWQFKLHLNNLLKFSPSEVKKNERRKQLEIEARAEEMRELMLKKKRSKVEKCRNMMEKGKCRFGSNCKFSHNMHSEDNESEKSDHIKQKHNKKAALDDHTVWYLEIRFPKWCKYPADPPLILLRTKIADIPKKICLRISQHLLDESRKLARDQIPSIYSIVDMLKNEEEIVEFLKKSESYYDYPPPEVSIFDYDPFGDSNGQSENNEENLDPLYFEKGKVIGKFDKQALTEEQIAKTNAAIMQKFRDKKRNSNYLKMLDQRKTLPTWPVKDEILKLINENQACIISGETGSGKSTQIPQFIIDEWLEKSSSKEKGVEVIVTQPRRLAAIGVSERISDERCERIGDIVGYQIRLENKISDKTRLTFCTTGILLRRLYSDPMIESVTHVLVDEVHERSEESDFLLFILRELMRKRPNLKVILMSATLNAKLFSEYFNNAPMYNIQGRTFPVTQVFLEEAIFLSKYVIEPDSQYCKKLSRKDSEELMQELEYVDAKANMTPPPRSVRDENLSLADTMSRYSTYSKTVCKTLFLMDHFKINPELVEAVISCIVESNNVDWPQKGSILIFLPGLNEIQAIYDYLRDIKNFTKKFILIPLHSSLSSEEQSMIFRKFSDKRKIILATNIAETSITIEDCTYVIDYGQLKEKRFDNNRNMESLETVWVSRANAAQRRGRAGRVTQGICFHLFTKHRHDNHLLAQPIPEIHRIPLEQLLLRIKILPSLNRYEISDVLNQCIEPPSSENIRGSIERLQSLGAMEKNESLTALGQHLAKIPVDVRIGKLMILGAIFQCLDSVLTICACLSHKTPFVSPFLKRREADARKRQFAISNSDHLTVLNAYRKWREAHKRSKVGGQIYADENYLSHRVLETIVEMKYQFLELLVDIGFVHMDIATKPFKGKKIEDNIVELTGNLLNANSENSRLIAGILCSSLYPNIVKIMTPVTNYVSTISGAMPRQFNASELKFKTRDDGYVALHPSSVNATCGNFQSPFLIYQEKVKTSRIFIRDNTMVSTIPIIIFSGSDVKIEMHDGEFLFILEGGWFIIQANSLATAECMKHMRKELMHILEEKIKNPLLNIWSYDRGKRIISTIIHLLTKE